MDHVANGMIVQYGARWTHSDVLDEGRANEHKLAQRIRKRRRANGNERFQMEAKCDVVVQLARSSFHEER